MKDLHRLCRTHISLMVALAAAFGYLLARPVVDAGLFYAAGGCFMLACACSAWNQAQEKDLDALMPRTRNRPVAAGRLSRRAATLLGCGLFLCSLGLFAGTGAAALPWTACAVVLIYNGLYTPLKKRSGFALLVGAVAGAMPVAMGWIAGGGNLADPLLALVYGVYLLWQIPHFWLRVEARRAEYQNAGLPPPPALMDENRYRPLLRLWFHAYAAALLLVPVFPLLRGVEVRIALSCLGFGLFIFGVAFFRALEHNRVKSAVLLIPVDAALFAASVLILTDTLYG